MLRPTVGHTPRDWQKEAGEDSKNDDKDTDGARMNDNTSDCGHDDYAEDEDDIDGDEEVEKEKEGLLSPSTATQTKQRMLRSWNRKKRDSQAGHVVNPSAVSKQMSVTHSNQSKKRNSNAVRKMRITKIA